MDKPEKLISQSYDGASVMSGGQSNVQTLIKRDYKYAFYVHCYAHSLNLILSQAASQNQDVRVFFSNLSDIANFFSHSPQRVAVLDEIVGQRIPQSSVAVWNFKSRTISTVYEHRELLIECMEKIEATSRQTVTINQATAICRMLHDSKFVFWLTVFSRILPHADILYNQLKETVTKPLQIHVAVTRFQNSLNKERNDMDSINTGFSEYVKTDLEYVKTEISEYGIQTKRRRNDENLYENPCIAAQEVCDTITSHIKERFSFTNHLNASTLFASVKFPIFEHNFPVQHLDATVVIRSRRQTVPKKIVDIHMASQVASKYRNGSQYVLWTLYRSESAT
ncbi:hypothetical protein NQ315_004596 [Exocentrus adspersus]|uniref:DUF4371 domain-containing protein n=1 Tax=Exocentrus adspersus TaxID=1586481 RepID=A0AAV8VNG4_9CUCU|nr:hypothetical protein NQ315_004596 [Exocentrus adspersus]